MRIPSYDDLTPPIEDVSPNEVFDVARVLTLRRPSAPACRLPAADALPGVFAALHSSRAPHVLLPIAGGFSPRVQRRGAATVVLDVSGLGRLLGEPAAIGAELHRAARERSPHVSVAVAPSQTAALLLAYAAAARVVADPVVTPDAAAALAALPIVVLRRTAADAFGADEDARRARLFDVLQAWGIATVGEFAALPEADLSTRLGQDGVVLQAVARGIDPAPLVPDPGVPRFVQRIELEWPIEQLEALSFVLARLLDPLAAALERADRGAAALRVDLRLTDRTTHARVLQLPAPMRDPRVLRTLVLLDLESHPPPAAIDVVTIEADPAPARIIQYSLLERARPSDETIATLTARLGALVGESRCGSPVLLDTHRPDGFELQRFTGVRGPGAGDRGAGDRGAGGQGDGQSSRRFNSPERQKSWLLDSLVPGPPTPWPPGLRRFRPPVAIRVAVEHGRPAAVAIDRRGMPGGRVTRVAGPWRTSGEWWHDGTHWDRDEWDVEVAEAVCRIFRDRVTEQWFMEGVID